MKLKKFLMIILFLVFTITLSSCNNDSKDFDYGLSSVKNETELRNLLKKPNSIFSNFFDSLGGVKAENSTADRDNAPEQSDSSTSYTKTNVQVEGVDEGDIIKTDGKRIYSINQNQLRVVEAKSNGELELVLNKSVIEKKETDEKTTFYSNNYFSELYLTDKYLVVLGQKYQQHIYNDSKGNNVVPDIYSYYTANSIVWIFDLETLEQVADQEISGTYSGSRLIGTNLYIISNYYNYNTQNEKFDPRPYIVNDGELDFFDYSDIKYLPNLNYESFTTITSVKLENDPLFDNDVFLGFNSWGTVYVTKSAIYFATYYYQSNFFGSDEGKGIVVSYLINDGDVTYGGAGNYNGRVINQFAIDEYNGYLRIVTTSGWGESAKNRLYVFERNLENEKYKLDVVGTLFEGVGKPGETVQSVRFNKDIVTVVTFLQTDPLYTIDLSNPKEPTIIGTLEVPGFSTYQHPWTDTLIIGIGYDADANGRTTGMKLSLFDISDKNNPVELGKPLFLSSKNEYSYSEALFNHKSIMIDKEYNQFAFTLNKYNWKEYNYYHFNSYLIFDVDPTKETPISIKHEITHETWLNDSNELDYYYNNYYYQIERGLRINNYIYTISPALIASHDLSNNLEFVDDIVF